MFKKLYRSIMLLVLIVGLTNQLSAAPVQADPVGCSTSVNTTDNYSLTICFTSPLDGDVLNKDNPVTVTVSYVGAHPNLSRIDFFLNGNYLLEAISPPYTFTLPTTFFVDGNYSLSAEVKMSTSRDFPNPFIQPLSERPSINTASAMA